MLNPFLMQDLDLMIAHSIGECKDLETKKKMANTILIVGGSTQFTKFVEELEDRLIETIPVYAPEIERGTFYIYLYIFYINLYFFSGSSGPPGHQRSAIYLRAMDRSHRYS